MKIPAISPVNSVYSKKVNKQNKTKNLQFFNQNISKKLKYPAFCGINFKGANQKLTIEDAISTNLFQLPSVTLEDGSVKQLVPDKSQIACAKHLLEGKSVVFDAPTGIGKTTVAHFAMGKNLQEGKKTIYTVPIKALANDKYDEFSKKYGSDNVGILTGDRKINAAAPIVIMTTEIFDNQAQSMDSSAAEKIGTVVYDEAHYLGDEERGFAWENSIINSASKGIQILCLSATVGNAADLTSWIGKIPQARPAVNVSVPSSSRPVPLVWHLFQKRKDGNRLLPVLIGEVDLSKNVESKSPEIQNLLFESEQDYYSRKDVELGDDFYRSIPDKLTDLFGKNWISTDFDLKENRLKLQDEFQSLTEIELNQISAYAKESALVLSDGQKLALETLYRAEYESNPRYEMTDEDYEFAYAQLKGGVGEGNNNFRFDTETFKKRLAREFRKLNDTQIEQIAQLMTTPESKRARAIHENWQKDDYAGLIKTLEKQDLLPAIIFKLAQGGCEMIANNLENGDLAYLDEDELTQKEFEEIERQANEFDLLTQEEKEQVQQIIDKYENTGVYLGMNPQKSMLLKGWAVHHAGRMPQYKKLVEELFAKKLIKVVMATSTLGAGINMPTRTVVMTNTAYKKYNQDTQEFEFYPLSANEFHQMTGRAGRRGIDEIGHVVLYNLHTPFDKFSTEEGKNKDGKYDELKLAYNLMTQGPDDIRSSFRPQPTALAKYYSQNMDIQKLENIIKQSFKMHQSKNKDKMSSQMLKKFENFTQVLLKQGHIIRDNKKQYTLTPKGEILTQCQGMNPLMLASLLYDEKLAKLNPAQLAQIAGHIQGSDEETESDALAQLTSAKVEILQTLNPESISFGEFEQAKNIFKGTEQKVLKALKEGIVNKSEIKQTDSFSGLVSYVFAKLNETDSDSIENFEKIYKTADSDSNADIVANKDYARKATEGNIYKIIAGSISTLKQITRICDFAINYSDLYPNTSYWEDLKQKAQEAIELLDKEPINNDPNYENKFSNI